MRYFYFEIIVESHEVAGNNLDIYHIFFTHFPPMVMHCNATVEHDNQHTNNQETELFYHHKNFPLCCLIITTHLVEETGKSTFILPSWKQKSIGAKRINFFKGNRI